jgi:hypothetical protein
MSVAAPAAADASIALSAAEAEVEHNTEAQSAPLEFPVLHAVSDDGAPCSGVRGAQATR